MLTWVSRGFKTFTKEEVLKPYLGRSYKNLIEMAGNHPSQGVGMKFWRKTWPENSYYIVTKVTFDDARHGKVWGIRTWQGKTEEKERIVPSILKLGVWKYSIKEDNEKKS